MHKYLMIVIFLAVSFFPVSTCYAKKLQFSLHKLESNKSGPTMLIFGGIQGDEPGGFNAASLLVTEYKIKSGAVWIVPNLNFESIIHRSRGIHGDMNRKFSHMKRSDPEYDDIQRIKSLIKNKNVDIILNLHDGSGFYRKRYIDKAHNPNRWGQSIIIDQSHISSTKFSDLTKLANKVANSVNRYIAKTGHYYSVRNTRTKNGDVEMEKTLTYFAIRNGKPAFGVEASKTFLTHQRALFHLLVLEGFMRNTGIEFEKDFTLTEKMVKQKIENNVRISLYENRIFLDVAKARNKLGYIPMIKGKPVQFQSNNPLVAVISSQGRHKVKYGNRQITYLEPEYFDFDYTLKKVMVQIDGIKQDIDIGSRIKVKKNFLIQPIDGYRINVIGYRNKKARNESGFLIKRSDIHKRYSVDKAENIFRVEFYVKNKFCGMILVEFNRSKVASL